MVTAPKQERRRRRASAAANIYERELYTARALRAFASSRGVPLQIHVPIRTLDALGVARVDAALLDGGRERWIAVEPEAVDDKRLRAVVARHARLGSAPLTIIAPGFESERDAGVELVSFRPNLTHSPGSLVIDADSLVPLGPWLSRATFQYRTAEVVRGARAPGRYRQQGQVDSIGALLDDIRRAVPASYTPVSVDWKFDSSPKQASSGTVRPYVRYIDGRKVHGEMFACTIEPTMGICVDCIAFSRRHARRLVDHLRVLGMEPSVFFDGRFGFQVFVFDRELVDVERLLVGGEPPSAQLDSPMLAFPGLVDAFSQRLRVCVQDIAQFSLAQAPVTGEP